MKEQKTIGPGAWVALGIALVLDAIVLGAIVLLVVVL